MDVDVDADAEHTRHVPHPCDDRRQSPYFCFRDQIICVSAPTYDPKKRCDVDMMGSRPSIVARVAS